MDTINTPQNFRNYLADAIDNGGLLNEDVVALAIPLFRKVLSLHEQQLVANLQELKNIAYVDGVLSLVDDKGLEPTKNYKALESISEKKTSRAFDIIKESHLTIEEETDDLKQETLNIQTDAATEIKKEVYLPGYHSYELKLGHHDELTDIFLLGLLLTSLALNIDIADPKNLERFAKNKNSLILLNPNIHPVISNLISEMTTLERTERARDLYSIIERLQNYQDYDENLELSIKNTAGINKKELKDATDVVMSKLKSRLFDFSKRNKLLYFTNSSKFLNLTVSSVPHVLDYKHIDPNNLFTWNDQIAKLISSGKSIGLSKYLKFEDNPYIVSTLDKIKADALRDKNEYGFNQLNLVIGFLKWYNLKESKYEPINSPLLLIPIDLKKKRGMKDSFVLDINSNEAEINPVLIYLFKDLFNIELPDSISLDEISLEEFFTNLKKLFEQSNSGIVITHVNKPRIQVIYTQAKQSLAQYKKRLKKQTASYDKFRNIYHSYDQEDFVPFGLQIFNKKIRPKATTLELLINEDIGISANPNAFSGTSTKTRSFYNVVQSSNEINPYHWEFDTTNITLGNFNSRKMSLVRDYNQISEANIQSAIFQELFADTPKAILEIKANADDVKNQYHVVASDPTQTMAIDIANKGISYIIQGPPGTGKSQTITNLIANYVARGKKVLFVCEKRAAIDVVYFRLKQQNLDKLCARIHDSQGDKKQFIDDLKVIYNEALATSTNINELEQTRETLTENIDIELAVLKRYSISMKNTYTNTGVPLNTLIERLIELKNFAIDLSEQELELIPEYKTWLEFGNIVTELSRALSTVGEDIRFAKHPISKLSQSLFTIETPINEIITKLERVELLLASIKETVDGLELPINFTKTIGDLTTFVNNTSAIVTLAQSQTLYLLNEDDPKTKEYEEMLLTQLKLERKYKEMVEKNHNWKNKLSQEDLLSALKIVTDTKDSIFSVFNSKLSRLKRTLEENYNFLHHSVRPEITTVLTNLQLEYQAKDELASLTEEAQFKYKTNDIQKIRGIIEEVKLKSITTESKDDIDFIKANLNNEQLIIAVSTIQESVTELNNHLAMLFSNHSGYSIKELLDITYRLRESVGILPDILPSIVDLATKAPKQFVEAIKNFPLSPQEAEAILGYKSLKTVYRTDKQFSSIEGTTIETRVNRINELYSKLMEINANIILARVQTKFVENVNLSAKSELQLNIKSREFKRIYSQGRKILENEFHKTIKFKSIRDLASKESGKVILDLKPIWLMSPLSISDTLPLDTTLFDVVIFDEASQITLEEGIPPLYRAQQGIIVGDEMQMPPTNFFSSKSDDTDVELEDEGTGENIMVDAESLLSQGARKLKSVMLGWHYRSRYEPLISFSNAAFYNRNMLTIPDRTIFGNTLNELIIKSPEEGHANTSALYDRPISFHYLENGIYEKRANFSEAEYIATLIKSLLMQDKKESIGIVAFSQEQQLEIENAIQKHAREDAAFNQKLEEAFARTEDDQFVGLFIKNLENVQGDERDIIIISICYGYDTKGKMLMNFGPINRKGGEKRLNVIFSRAKKHMAVVSSIHHFDIKNEYNEGANYFRKFLQYAEEISKGNNAVAKLVLESMSTATNFLYKADNHIVANELAIELAKLGYKIEKDVGQSYMKCQIGIVDPMDKNKFKLAILIDNKLHYENPNLLEQYFLRPNILKAFGWKVHQVFIKDWYHAPEKVLNKIILKLEDKDVPLIEEKIIEEVKPPIKIVQEDAKPEILSEPTMQSDVDISENVEVIESTKEVAQNVDTQDELVPAGKGKAAKVNSKTIVNPTKPKSVKIETKQEVSGTDNPNDLKYERFELIDESHSKYWEVARDNNKMYIRYGRIGTKGQLNLKVFDSAEVAQREVDKIKSEKVKKGYKKV